MLLARVIGTVVATQKEPELDGLRFLLLRNANEAGEPVAGTVVAADAVGAGVGELVLYAAGSSARQTAATKDRPVDHVVMAIVDEVAEGGEVRYRKTEEA